MKVRVCPIMVALVLFHGSNSFAFSNTPPASTLANEFVSPAKLDYGFTSKEKAVFFPLGTVPTGYLLFSYPYSRFQPACEVANLGDLVDSSLVLKVYLFGLFSNGDSMLLHSRSEQLPIILPGDSLWIELDTLQIVDRYKGFNKVVAVYELVTSNSDDHPANNKISAGMDIESVFLSKAGWDPSTNGPKHTSAIKILDVNTWEKAVFTAFYIPDKPSFWYLENLLTYLKVEMGDISDVQLEIYLLKWDDVDGDGEVDFSEIEIFSVENVYTDITQKKEYYLKVRMTDFQTGDLLRINGPIVLIAGIIAKTHKDIFIGIDESTNYGGILKADSLNGQIPLEHFPNFSFDQIINGKLNHLGNNSGLSIALEFCCTGGSSEDNTKKEPVLISTLVAGDHLEVRLETEAILKPKQILLFNSKGVHIGSKDLEQNSPYQWTMDISPLAHGIYFIKVITDIGEFNKKVWIPPMLK